MATQKKGILGPAAGKVGDVIGSSWNGIPYFRARPVSYHDAKTPTQLNNRMKMTVTQKFLKAITPYLRIGFRNYTVGQSAYNAAASYTRNNALLITEADDIAMPMAYNLSKMEAAYSTQGFLRANGEASVKIPDKWKGDSLSCFLTFASQNSKAVSNSEYLGEICV